SGCRRVAAWRFPRRGLLCRLARETACCSPALAWPALVARVFSPIADLRRPARAAGPPPLGLTARANTRCDRVRPATTAKEDRLMPEVYVHAVEGRTLDQKRALVKDITDAVVRNFNVKPEAVMVQIMESPK